MSALVKFLWTDVNSKIDHTGKSMYAEPKDTYVPKIHDKMLFLGWIQDDAVWEEWASNNFTLLCLNMTVLVQYWH